MESPALAGGFFPTEHYFFFYSWENAMPFQLNICFLCEVYLTALIIFSFIFWVPDIFCNTSVSEPMKLSCNYLFMFLSFQLQCKHSQCRDLALVLCT